MTSTVPLPPATDEDKARADARRRAAVRDTKTDAEIESAYAAAMIREGERA